MTLPPPERLGDESPDPELLHLFVYGPGYGEGIALRLPGGSWLVVDGCAHGERRPLVELLERFPDDSIDAVILTHPHTDHTAGMLELIAHPCIGPRIQKLGCVARNLETVPDNTLGAELAARARSLDPVDPADLESFGLAQRVLERLRSEWEDNPGRRLPLVDGSSVPVSTSLVRVTAIAPSSEDVAAFFGRADLPKRIRSEANELSIVLKVEFGATALLLGADLPRVDAREVPVPSGWIAVAERNAGLDQHAALKVPHHASKDALGDELLGTIGAGRAWVATPWNKGRGLPRFEGGHGAARLLGTESEFMLTGLPVSVRRQQPQPERMPIDTLMPAVATLRKAPRLLAGATAANDPTVNPSDCVWVLSFDSDGRLVQRRRGPRATLVTA